MTDLSCNRKRMGRQRREMFSLDFSHPEKMLDSLRPDKLLQNAFSDVTDLITAPFEGLFDGLGNMMKWLLVIGVVGCLGFLIIVL